MQVRTGPVQTGAGAELLPDQDRGTQHCRWNAAADQACGHRYLPTDAAVYVVEARLPSSDSMSWTKLDCLSVCSTVTAEPQQLCSNISKVLAALAAIAMADILA